MYISHIFCTDKIQNYPHFSALFGQQPSREPDVTFVSLKMRVIELVLRALMVENDSANTQMLLGADKKQLVSLLLVYFEKAYRNTFSILYFWYSI